VARRHQSAAQRSEDEPVTDAEDMVCVRCGGRAEAGFLAAWRQLRWSAGGRWRRWTGWGDEVLASSWAYKHIAAGRCGRCGLVWFEA
jgi:ribosomal protein S27AE